MLLRVGETCWRSELAERGALILDMADCFRAAREAFLAARSTIHLLNWAFDPDTPFVPQADAGAQEEERFGPFLRRLACERPDLDVRILCWKSALPIAATQRFFPHRAKACFEGSPVRFILDHSIPLGACHHQKAIIIDDRLAFCGGGDIAPDRWDTPRHLDDDPGRRKSRQGRAQYPPRHEVMGLVEGPVAAALGDLFRDRWREACGEPAPKALSAADPLWPSTIEAQFHRVRAGLSRTAPAWRDAAGVRENEALHLTAIAAARRCIYLENQYFTSPVIAEALAARLAEPDGPEVVMISTLRSPSWFDHVTMDRARSSFLRRLHAADVHGRFSAYTPFTAGGRPIIVHAKLSIIDDVLLRMGSANLNNRSSGFDTECDLSFEAGPEDAAALALIAASRTRTLAHWLGCPAGILDKAIDEAGGVGAAVERFRRVGSVRLRPLLPQRLGPLAIFIAAFHIGDPVATSDSWRPWRRKRATELERQRRVGAIPADGSLDAGGAERCGPKAETSRERV